jgi:hypothetical protein
MKKLFADEENGKILFMVNRCDLGTHRLHVCQENHIKEFMWRAKGRA